MARNRPSERFENTRVSKGAHNVLAILAIPDTSYVLNPEQL
jgi:hypothetical protein